MINYWHYSPSGAVSLDPRTSDSYINFCLMYQVVGTLLRNSASGNYEPFLAESWFVSNEGRKYTFKLRSNLKTKNGKDINAQSYYEVFHYLVRYLLNGENSSLVQFDRLVGMEDYISSKNASIAGLSIDIGKNEISFLFQEKPDDLLIAFTEPMFGFYNLDDFANLELRNKRAIDSSGMFSLEEISADGRSIILSRRQIFSSGPDIKFQLFGDGQDFASLAGYNVVYGMTDLKPEWIEKLSFTKSDPNMLGALVLSPLVHPFSDLESRQIIRNSVHKNLRLSSIDSPRSTIAKYFNFLSVPDVEFEVNEISTRKLSGSYDVAYFNLFGVEVDFLEDLFEKVEKDTGLRLSLKKIDRGIPGEFERVVGDKEYPSRFSTVVVGGSSSNQNNKMMFCSNLGVSFKDPSGQLCKLILEYELKSGEIEQNYINKFNKILWNDAVVLPVMHMGFMWMHSKEVNAEALKSGLGMPRLDLLTINE